ncbi:MAG: peptide chain release factor 2 [Deltaproteobacteria bacterium]|nr:peptide chain release factor 2 [Deltaproteobacteria bacterium]
MTAILNISELKQRVEKLKTSLQSLGGYLDLENKERRLQEIANQSAMPDFWDNVETAQVVLKERGTLSEQVERARQLLTMVSDCEVLLEFVTADETEAALAELNHEIEKTEQVLADFELSKMLSGEHDVASAIVEINSGAGGTEAQDWCEMLLRMYLRWAEKQGYKVQILSIHEGETAGIKNVSVLIEGVNAFGYLRAEQGIHRLVRISPFDSNARRHTSFSSISVMPDLDTEIDIVINEDELKIDTYRSSGAGGQHINKTDSAVRITHLPTGIVVACQTDRSQHKNKAQALKILKIKLYELEETKKREVLDQMAGERRKIDFGSQIRSYVMHPYQMVKDHRTNFETGDTQSVLDGELWGFIRAYLMDDYWNKVR